MWGTKRGNSYSHRDKATGNEKSGVGGVVVGHEVSMDHCLHEMTVVAKDSSVWRADLRAELSLRCNSC